MNQELDTVTEQEFVPRYQQLLQETQALSTRLAVVHAVSQAATAALDLDAILEVVVEQTKWVLDYDRCRIALRNGDGAAYRQWWLYNPVEPQAGARVEEQRDTLGEGLAGWVMRHSRVLRLNGDEESSMAEDDLSQVLVDTRGATSVLALPLTVDSKAIGALTFESQQRHAYSDADVRLGMILADQIAIATVDGRATSEFAHMLPVSILMKEHTTTCPLCGIPATHDDLAEAGWLAPDVLEQLAVSYIMKGYDL